MNQSATRFRPLGLLFAIPAFVAPVMGFFAPRGVTPLVVLVALIIAGMALARGRRPAVISAPLATVLVLLCIWALISALWAPDAWLAIRGAMKLFGNLLAGALLFGLAGRLGGDHARTLHYGLAGGFTVTFLMLLVEVVYGAPISALIYGELPVIEWFGYYWLNSSASILSLLAWPLALVLWRRVHPAAAVLLLGAMIAVVAAMSYITATAALIIGMVFAAATFVLRERAATVFAAGFVALVVVMPLLSGTILKPDVIANAPDSVRQTLSHRLYIWQFTAEKLAEHPLRGWGMNASRVIPGGKDRAVDPKRRDLGENLPLHPHNMMLQIWLELGLPGALLISTFGALVILRLGASGVRRDAAAIRMGLMGTVLVISGASFGTWSSWWLCTMWLAAAVTAIVTAPPRQAGGSRLRQD